MSILWTIQILLALLFLGTGLLKLARSKQQLKEAGLHALDDLSRGQIRTIGVLEVLGALGVVLPSATGILPSLTPIAAVGLLLIMIAAAIQNFRVGEQKLIFVNVLVAVLAVFVVYSRF